MSLTNELLPVLKKLRLNGVLQTLNLHTKQTIDNELSFTEFLFQLLSDEVERREAKQLEQQLQRANFRHNRTLKDFDFHFNPSIPKTKVIDLTTNTFITRRENILLIGQAGVGKSHLAQTFEHRACRLNHPVVYVGASEMFKQLQTARGDSTYERRLLRFTSPTLLIIDDLGLHPLRGEEPLNFYEIIRQRYERGATIITSNRDDEELTKLFRDPLLASAAMDRLLHHAHILVIEGQSYRNPPSNRRTRSKTNPNKKKRKEPRT